MWSEGEGAGRCGGRGRGRGARLLVCTSPSPQPQVFLFQKGSHRRCESLLSRSGEGCQFRGKAARGGGLWRRLTPPGVRAGGGWGLQHPWLGGEGRAPSLESQVRRPRLPKASASSSRGRAAAAFRVGADGRPAPSPGSPSLLVRRPAQRGRSGGGLAPLRARHLGAAGWKWSWGWGSRGQQVRRSQEAAGTLQVRGDGASPGGQAGWKQRWPLCCPDIWHPGHMWPHPDQKMDMREEKLDLPQQPWDAGRGNSKGF